MKLKRIIAVVLTLLMLAGIAPLSVSAAAIPSDATTYKGHSYKRYDLSMTWTEAKAYCEKLGGHLVTITSAEEQSVIDLIAYVGKKSYYWIGLYDDGSNRNWKWVTGESLKYTNWMPTEPNNDFQTKVMLNQSGRWIDNPNEGDGVPWNLENIGFICEWDYASGKVTSVSVEDMTINYKSSDTLRPVVMASGSVKYTTKYESLNPAVVTVDQYGNIDGIKKGVADIKVTVTDENGNTVSDTCTVTVQYSTIQWIIVIVLFGWLWY